jgi:hypothetical protein
MQREETESLSVTLWLLLKAFIGNFRGVPGAL